MMEERVEDLVQKSAAVILKDKKLLIVKQSDHPVYILPGGKRGEKENFEEALIRELAEELEVVPEIFRFFRIYTSIGHPPFNKPIALVTYIIEKFHGELKPGAEIVEMQWMSKKEYEDEKYSMPYLMRKRVVPDLINKGWM